MRIGIDANEANLTPNRVGINQYAFDLIHALYNQKTAHEFVVYLKTPPLADMPLSRPGWSYRVIPFPKLWTQTRLPFDLYTYFPRPDVFFSLTHYAPRWSPVPSVVAIMDLGFLTSREQFTTRDFNQLKSWTEYSVKQAAHIVTISEYTKQDIIKNYGAHNITVTYPGYDSQLFKPTKNPSVLSKYHISAPYFLFLSSLKPSKNIEGLVKAYASGNFSEQLVISGKKAWLFDKIFSLVKELGISDKVVFTGFVKEEEVPVLMSMAEAFVMPSFFEGFGIPILEAMACNTPVVVSKIASIPEVAGNAGIYVNPTDTLSIISGLKTATGPERQTYTSKGLAQVKKFTWETCAKQTLTVLEAAALD